MALLIARHGMSYTEAARTTLVEFEVYNTAYAIKQEDIRFNAAIQAWYNQTVQATKGKGKSVRSAYRTFNEFYDHEKEFSKIFKPEDTAPRSRTLSLADKNRIINQTKKGGS